MEFPDFIDQKGIIPRVLGVESPGPHANLRRVIGNCIDGAGDGKEIAGIGGGDIIGAVFWRVCQEMVENPQKVVDIEPAEADVLPDGDGQME
jgi:hypothetical protein